MRVLIAYDGSSEADQALSLAATLRWPPASSLRIAAAATPVLIADLPAGPVVADPALDDAVAALLEQRLSEAADRLRGSDSEVETTALVGRPATVLVDEARRMHADLVIAGARGHGRVARLLLGSVSAELVDNAPCPVLVARTGRVDRVVLAVDGSEPAEVAEDVVASWPMFEGLPIDVLSVADVPEPVQFGFAPAAYHQAAAEAAAHFAESQERHTRIAAETAERLRAAGREAVPAMRTGAAADEILDFATEAGADLIVVGTRGQTGLTRMILGSVARNVLQGSRGSVLVVRPPSLAEPD